MHGDVWQVNAAEMQIQNHTGTWQLLVGLIPELPLQLLLGRDWPAFPTATRVHQKKKPMPTATWVWQAYMAQEGGDTSTEGEIPTLNNFFFFFCVSAGNMRGGLWARTERG